MKHVRLACEKWEKDEKALPPEFQKIKLHFIFDIKMSDKFRRRARLVANAIETEAPAALTYLIILSQESVMIALLLASLNDLEILACNIQNAYLSANCRE